MCEYCKPYEEKFIDGENGDACVTKNGELIFFPILTLKLVQSIKKSTIALCAGANLWRRND